MLASAVADVSPMTDVTGTTDVPDVRVATTVVLAAATTESDEAITADCDATSCDTIAEPSGLPGVKLTITGGTSGT